ncbi:peptidoglycan/LPS O-acetylase OafA/YrhL [Flavimobilis soli]|uniref:Peptidoglycan/LPS O-acetylase OafA/YrhL n=1 Tax=Flavimobilis soli TaxID=442709 RepID=A0A2A9EH18_9MICO|nr:acyltransferase family protein [Flavimobilis soli]PFG37821.1 peptidoglycan/LPS O-acetylase OafA/YrhL [Flavimobilis soli]
MATDTTAGASATATVDAAEQRPPAAGAERRRTVRKDIEGLRALAVTLVVVYHLWPGVVTGGFIGVDVFLVVSGFLITSHLLQHPPRTPRDLAEFWGRRIRRLLPASFLVLAVTLVASWLVAPPTQWAETTRQIIASTFYLENWALAKRAVDYLAADSTPTPVQHFWSLGVEEQFYLGWPVLVLVLAAVARVVARRSGRAGRMRLWVTGGLAGVVALSFSASVLVTAKDPAQAYFATHVRVWELGAGALLAGAAPVVARALDRRRVARAVLAWAGLAAIVAAALVLDASAPFPGAVALAPVLGTVAVIAAHSEGRGSPEPLLTPGPVQYVGSVSYAIYLWHWPLIVLLPLALGRDRTLLDAVVIVALTLALAAATKVCVEDPLRGRHPLGVPLRRTYVFMALGMVVLVSLALLVRADLRRVVDAGEQRLATAFAQPDPCFGAAALVTPGCAPHGAELVHEPVVAMDDMPDPYEDDCWVLGPLTRQKVCTYGSTAPDARDIALVGNSHGGHWLPALQELAEEENLRIHTYLVSRCFTVTEPLAFGDARTQACQSWNERVLSETSDGRYDLVVVSNLFGMRLAGVPEDEQEAAARAAYTRSLDRWVAGGVPTIVVRDTPHSDLPSVPDCVAAHLDDLGACDGGRDREQVDPLADAAEEHPSPLVTVLDLTDRFCRDDTCYSTIGGLIAYFDGGHMSASFARTLAPALAGEVRAALSR